MLSPSAREARPPWTIPIPEGYSEYRGNFEDLNRQRTVRDRAPPDRQLACDPSLRIFATVRVKVTERESSGATFYILRGQQVHAVAFLSVGVPGLVTLVVRGLFLTNYLLGLAGIGSLRSYVCQAAAPALSPSLRADRGLPLVYVRLSGSAVSSHREGRT